MYRRRRDRRALTAVLVLAQCLPALAGAASGGLLGGDLGHWLNTAAGPALLEILDHHPRFHGETLRVLPMQGGKPTSQSNRLSVALQRALEHQLLQSTSVRIAARDTTGPCGVQADIPYLLGVEIERDGADRYRVHLAVTDVDEGIWVNGASQTWSGRLTTSQRAALRERASSDDPGSLANPLALSEPGAIADALNAQLRCALRTLPQTDVRLVTDDPDLEGVRRQMDSRLRGSTRLRTVSGPAPEASLLRIRSSAPGPRRDVVLELEDPQGSRAAQRLASVAVAGFDVEPAGVPSTRPIAGSPPAPLPTDWLSGLRFQPVAPTGVCREAPYAACVEVELDLLQPLYLMVFQTHDGRLDVPSCGRTPNRRTGEQRFRFSLQPARTASAAADAGFYAIVTNDTTLARLIAQHLAKGPGACRNRGASAPATTDAWLSTLDLMLTQHADVTEWRALHLNHEPSGPVAL